VEEWGTIKVITWMQEAGLQEGVAAAKEGGWNGRTLLSLYESSEKGGLFASLCQQLGLSSSPHLHAFLFLQLSRLFRCA